MYPSRSTYCARIISHTIHACGTSHICVVGFLSFSTHVIMHSSNHPCIFGVPVREQVLQPHSSINSQRFYCISVLVSLLPPAESNLHYPCRAREICGLKSQDSYGLRILLLNLFVDAWIYYDDLCQATWIHEHIVTGE